MYRILFILFILLGLGSNSLSAQCPNLSLDIVDINGDPTLAFCEGETITFAYNFGTPCDFISIGTELIGSTVLEFFPGQTNFTFVAPPVAVQEVVNIEVVLNTNDGIDTMSFVGFSINPNANLTVAAPEFICASGSVLMDVSVDIPLGEFLITSQPQGEIIYESTGPENLEIENIEIDLDEPTEFVITWFNDVCETNFVYTPTFIEVDSIELGVGGNPACQGDSVTIAIQNLQPGTYTWIGTDIPDGFQGSEISFIPQFSQTVIVNYQSPENCAAQAQLQVIVQSPPNVTINPQNPTICDGQSIVLSANTTGLIGVSQWFDEYGMSLDIGNTYEAMGGTEDFIVIYQFIDDNTECEFVDTIEIIISEEDGPEALFSYAESLVDPICAESEIALFNESLNATSYEWSMPGATPSSSTDQNPSVSYMAQGQYFITLIATGDCGGQQLEIDSLTLPINISAPVVFNPSFIEVNTCIGDTIILTVSDFNGPDECCYEWSGPFGFFSGDSISITTVTPGIYPITVNWDNGICDQTASYSIEFFDTPQFEVMGDSLCLGEDLNLSFSSLELGNPIASVTIESNFLPSQTTTSNSITVTPQSGEIYSITAEFDNGCSSTQEFTPDILIPFIQITPEDPNSCTGNDIILSATIIGSGDITWTADSNPAIIETGPILNLINVTESSTYYAFYDNGFCTVSDSVTIEITEDPEINISMFEDVPCEGAYVCTDVTSISDDDGAIIWTYGLQAGTGGSDICFFAELEQFLIITWQDDDGDCTAVDTFLIDVNLTPNLQINGYPNDTISDICEGSGFGLTASGAPGSDLIWNGACVGTTQSGPSPQFIACAMPGWLYVSLTDTSCFAIDSIYLDIDIVESLQAIPLSSFCEGDTVIFQALGGLGNNEDYSWSYSGDDDYVFIDSVNGQVQFVPTESGNLLLSYNSPVVCNSVDPLQVPITLVPSYVPLEATLIGQTPEPILEDTIFLCLGESVILNNADYSSEELQWITCEGDTIVEDDYIVSSDVVTVCNITVTLTLDCFFSRDLTIVFEEPELTNFQPEYEVCSGEDLEFDFFEADSCQWMNTDFISNAASCAPIFNYDIPIDQQQLINYEFLIWQDGCSRLYSTDVRVFPKIQPNMPADTTVCSGSIPFIAPENPDCSDITWFPSIEEEIFENTPYTMTAICGNCTTELDIMVTVLDDCGSCSKDDMPSAITPNADGVNDTWEIKCPGAEVTVMNRSGTPVFSSTNYQNEFDGLNGQLSGTFFFIVNPADGSDMITGTITIIK